MTTSPLPDHGDWLQTFSGVAFDLRHPAPRHVKIGDVAHHLAHINRFTGACDRAYSVAQHSLLVMEILRDMGVTDTRTLLQGLTHDAAEAYLGDMARPLKRLLPEYRALEARVWHACALALGVQEVIDPLVKEADDRACRIEAHAFLPGTPLGGWAGDNELHHHSPSVNLILQAQRSPQDWTRRWLRTYYQLGDRHLPERPLASDGAL